MKPAAPITRMLIAAASAATGGPSSRRNSGARRTLWPRASPWRVPGPWRPALLAVAVVFAARLLLVLLFLPFSALDKLLNWKAALDQAGQGAPKALAPPLILAGLGVEVFMSLGVLTGVADRLAALVLAAYCVATAVLWKPFWTTPDFRLRGPSRGREEFWDFLKNLAVAGGFLMVTFGASASGVASFAARPFASSHPYAVPETQHP